MKFKQIFLALIAAAGIFSITSCSGAKSATLNNMYVSDMNTQYQNMRPGYNFYIFIERYQTLEVYSDNTYVFTVSTTTVSALDLAESGNDYTASPTLMAQQKFYGTYTSAVDELDEETTNYELAAPTRYTLVQYGSQTGNKFFDTANWTETMSEEAGADENDAPLYTTGEAYLNQEVTNPLTQTTTSLIWKEAITIAVSETTHQFDFDAEATPLLLL